MGRIMRRNKRFDVCAMRISDGRMTESVVQMGDCGCVSDGRSVVC